RAAGLRAGYPGRGEVLSGLDLEVRSGHLCAVIGPNGAGKSTVVRILAGLLPRFAGEVDLFGRPIGSYDRRDIARRVAVVHQSTARSSMGGEAGFTVAEVVMMGRAPHQSAWMRASAEDHLIVEQ